MRHVIFVLMLAAAPWAQAADDFFTDVFGDMQANAAEAREAGKAGVFVFFEMDECPFCDRMKTQVFSEPEVVEYMHDHFVTASVDIEGDVTMTDFSGDARTQKDFAFGEHRVRATPVMIFFDVEGKQATRYTGPVRSPEEFLMLAEFVSSGAYKEPGMNFVRYKQQQGR
ncbi:MAG: thioredoxin family protein [Halothiobacillaceae bacterium]